MLACLVPHGGEARPEAFTVGMMGRGSQMGCRKHVGRIKVTYKLVTELILDASFRESARGCRTVYRMLRRIPDNSDPRSGKPPGDSGVKHPPPGLESRMNGFGTEGASVYEASSGGRRQAAGTGAQGKGKS